MSNADRGQLLERIAQLEASLSELRRELVGAQEESDGTFDALTFVVSDKTYAVFLADVIEVLRMVKWQPLAKAPPDIQGVVNCRGSVLPVLNPGTLFADKPVEPGVNNALVVLAAAGQSIAMMVDQVLGVQAYRSRDFTLVADGKHAMMPSYIVGFIKVDAAHVSVVDINQMLSTHDQRALQAALRERDEWGRI